MEKARTLTSERTNERRKTTIMSVHSNFPHVRQLEPVSLYLTFLPGYFFVSLVCVKRRVKHRNHGSFYCVEGCVTKLGISRNINSIHTLVFIFRKKKQNKTKKLNFFFFNLVSGLTFSEELRSQPRICYFYSIYVQNGRR